MTIKKDTTHLEYYLVIFVMWQQLTIRQTRLIDGRFSEIDMSLSFTETRTLSKKDVILKDTNEYTIF